MIQIIMGVSLTLQIGLTLENFQHIWMIVAEWHWRDLGIKIQNDILIDIDNVVAAGFIVVGEELHSPTGL